MNEDISKKMEDFDKKQQEAQMNIENLECQHHKNIEAFNKKVEDLNRRIDENEQDMIEIRSMNIRR